MIKRWGRTITLIGILSLAAYFAPVDFLVDKSWFLLGGIGFTALGLLIKRRNRIKKARKRMTRRFRRDRVGND